MTYGVYRVIGKRAYRGHEPGTTFEARLQPGPESRAIARGDTQLLRHVTPSIPKGALRLPDDWPPSVPSNNKRGSHGSLSH
jgi:hypothetical protein